MPEQACTIFKWIYHIYRILFKTQQKSCNFGRCHKLTLQTVLKLGLYLVILYLLLDLGKDALLEKSGVKTRETNPNTLPVREITTTSSYDITGFNDAGPGDVDDSNEDMPNGTEGVNNVIAWKELKESQNFMMADNYYSITNVLSQMPKMRYLDNFKNPCWHEKKSPDALGKIRCLPYFFLAGVEKCGTTDLFYRLLVHDMIEAPFKKEPHFWAKLRVNHHTPISGYLRFFDDASTHIHRYVRRTPSEYYHPRITLDASADTFLFNFLWKTFQTKMLDHEFSHAVLTPYHIKHILPDAKFVVILRNPVDRLYSSYNFFPLLVRKPGMYKNVSRRELASNSYNTKSPEDFHNHVVRALQWFENCTNVFPNSHRCLFWNEGQETIHNFISQLQMGFYGVTLKFWLEVFAKEQFKIIRLEDYSVDKVSSLNAIFDFLGVDSLSANMTQRISDTKALNLGQRQRKHGLMLPETRQLLVNFYRPYNQMLADLLQDSKFQY